MERDFQELSYTAPEPVGEKVSVDADMLEKHLGDLARSAGLGRYALGLRPTGGAGSAGSCLQLKAPRR